jgi:holin-like protein
MPGLAGVGSLLLLVVALEGLVGALGVVIPPAVLAMALLTLFFVWHGGVPDFLARGATILFRVFPLLFVPPLVSVIGFRDIIIKEWLILLLVVSLSTVAGLITTAIIYRCASKGRDAA